MVEFSNSAKTRPQYKGQNSQKKQIKPPKKITEKYLYNSGLAYLQRFPASSMHFRTVMMRKINKSCRHHTDQDAEQCATMLDNVVEQFKELSLLDDTAYLEGMVRSLRRRGLSAMQIYYKLQQKGYKRDQVDNTIKQYDREEWNNEDNGDIHAALIFARRKRLGPFDVLNKKDPEKSLASMARAGYSYDIAKKTLNMSAEELPEDFTLSLR